MKRGAKRIVAIAIIIAIAINFMPIMSYATSNSVWDGSAATSFAGGDGSASNPYCIETSEQFAYFAAQVNAGNTYAGKYVSLTSDIYFNEIEDFSTWGETAPQNNWTPIGTSDSPFSGIFDGNNHVVYGLYVSLSKAAGLFAYTDDCVIRNLSMRHSYVKGSTAAGLSAYVYSGDNDVTKISNVSISGHIISSYNAGGVVASFSRAGQWTGNCLISGCDFDGAVSGSGSVGGIYGGGPEYIEIQNCFVAANVYGTGSRIGGIAGSAEAITNCAVAGSVIGKESVGGIMGYKGYGYGIDAIVLCANYASVTGSSQVGGIIGGTDSGPIIRESFNTGTVSGQSYVGGIAGDLLTRSQAINCYNTGTVTGTGTADHIAGLIGHCEFNGAGTQNCYNTGKVENGNAICAEVDNGGTVSNCYYLDGVGISSCGTALSMAAFGSSASFSGFDFSSVWTMNAAADRPVLKNNPEVMKNVSCQILVLDIVTSKPIAGAVVQYEGNEISTDENGMAILTIPGHYYTSNHNLTVTKDGYNDFVCYLSDLDVGFDVIKNNTIMCTPLDGEGSAESVYINEHIGFHLGSFNKMSDEHGFYNVVWEHEDGKRLWLLNVWEVIGDVGEFLSWKFDDFTINADYYELYIADLILMLTETKLLDEDAAILTSAAKSYDKAHDLFLDNFVLKAIEKALEDEEIQNNAGSLLEGMTVAELLTNKELFKTDLEKILLGDESGVNPAVKAILEDVYDESMVDESLFCELFDGLSFAAEISDFCSDNADTLKDVGNAWIMASCCAEVNKELFDILEKTAKKLEENTSIFNKEYHYARWFREGVNDYRAVAESKLGCVLYLLSENGRGFLTMTGHIAFDYLFRGRIESVVAESLGLNIPQLKILVGAYCGTYNLMDKITGLDDKSQTYHVMNYIGPVEGCLAEVVKEFGDELVASPTYEKAQKYDLAYQTLKLTNKYLYESAYNFAAAQKDAEEMKLATFYKNTWNLNNCHNNYVVDRSKYVSAQCPVDVYLYNSDGELVVAIVNEEVVTYSDPLVTIMNCDGKKSLMYPADRDYSIEIESREEGQMEYYISEVEGISQSRDVEFYDLSLTEGQTYAGEIPQEFGLENAVYALKTDENQVLCDYDSLTAATCTDGHSFGEWTVEEEAGCLYGGLKTRLCSVCGKKETDVVAESEGHSFIDGICTVCGAETQAVNFPYPAKSLHLEGAISVNMYLAFEGQEFLTQEFIEKNGGVLVWDESDLPENTSDAIHGTETYQLDVQYSSVYNGHTEYLAMTKGIPASCYADKIYYRSYIAMDGGYCYGDIQEYSVKQYCESRFENTTDENLKPLLAAILNYGSAAQDYFDYNADALVNADMQSYVNQGWIEADLLNMAWSDDFLIPLVKPAEEMTENFIASGTLPAISKSLLLEGTISVNYYATFGEDAGVFADVTDSVMYFWTAEDYEKLVGAGTPLCVENASYSEKAELVYSDEYGWEYKVTSKSIPAACWGDSLYSVLCVTDSDGISHCSGVITYSPARFAFNKLNDEEQTLVDELVKWMMVYCDRAKIYFDEQ